MVEVAEQLPQEMVAPHQLHGPPVALHLRHYLLLHYQLVLRVWPEEEQV
jgi:hypothetical protein